MHGFEKAMYSCDYVIVLDDDLKLHPGTIATPTTALADLP
jgi:hypothetical protein